MKAKISARTRGRTRIAITVTAAALGITATSPVWSQAAPTASDVRVINSPSQPVPISAQGTTQVAGSVGIDPSANTVRIAGAPAAPTPIQRASQLTLGLNEGNKVAVLFTVPAGKRFVGKYVSVRGPVASGTRLRGEFEFNLDEARVDIVTPFERSPNSLDTEFAEASMPILAYAGPGTEVIYRLTRIDASAISTYRITLVGELVDVPAAS